LIKEAGDAISSAFPEMGPSRAGKPFFAGRVNAVKTKRIDYQWVLKNPFWDP
jgi:hypothetical protein